MNDSHTTDALDAYRNYTLPFIHHGETDSGTHPGILLFKNKTCILKCATADILFQYI